MKVVSSTIVLGVGTDQTVEIVDWEREIDRLPVLVRDAQKVQVETWLRGRGADVAFVSGNETTGSEVRYFGNGPEMVPFVRLMNLFNEGVSVWGSTPESLFLSACTHAVRRVEGRADHVRFPNPESWSELRKRVLSILRMESRWYP